ncbi:MAG: sulfurtransferase complex subunit TusC [Methylomicrobium sp.]
MKKFLFVLRKAPFSGVSLQETLDSLLTIAAFDQPVSILWLDDGVFQIKKHQQPEGGFKDTAAIFAALDIYDVHDIRVEVESLQQRGLKPGDLTLPVREMYRKEVAAYIKTFDVVLSG